MSSYWVNFSKNGNPNGGGLPVWPAFDEKERKTMFFDKIPSARPHPNLDQLKAFDAYYAKLREIERLDVSQAGREAEPFVKDPETLTIWSREFFRDVIRRIVFV